MIFLNSLDIKIISLFISLHLFTFQTPITPPIKKNETISHFLNGQVADKNNFDYDNRAKIISGWCNYFENM